MISRIVAVALLAITVSGCATFKTFEKVQEVANATVPAEIVIPAANTFNIVKAGATRFAEYCIREKFAPAVCEEGTRRAIVKAIRVGSGARKRMRDTLANGTPASASVYNLMVGAIQDLQNSPANSPQFVGAAQ
jgi:hypothetical protein